MTSTPSRRARRSTRDPTWLSVGRGRRVNAVLAVLLLGPAGAAPRASAQGAPDLLDVAAGHVAIAESTRDETQLWGRLGGSPAEHRSAELLAEQLEPWVDEVRIESFSFEAHRPRTWRLTLADGTVLRSAVPAPFDARFPESTRAALVAARTLAAPTGPASAGVAGKWIYHPATMDGSPGRNSVRSSLLYERAADAEAAGLVFSLPFPTGRWRAVVPVDKPYALPDERYPDGRRPIPSFAVDAVDGALLAEAAARGSELVAEVRYAGTTGLEGHNVVARLAGRGERTVVLAAHLDSFYSGANDNASGLATLVGLAHRLSRLPADQRLAHFVFLGQAAHHDAAAGMRAWLRGAGELDPDDHVILVEHTEARAGEDRDTGWPELNDFRAAYVGPRGWPEVEAALPELVRASGLMSRAPQVVRACIADLFVPCGEVVTFTLIQGPPFYHTDHDMLDKISRSGLENAVDFHLRLLDVSGSLTGGPDKREEP